MPSDEMRLENARANINRMEALLASPLGSDMHARHLITKRIAKLRDLEDYLEAQIADAA